MPMLNTPSDALPLLACKIAPRQFDLSYRFSSISLRDQIVRAQTLIRTLVEQNLVVRHVAGAKSEFELLIVGAGAAGLAAAAEASSHGVSFVLIESGVEVPGGVLHSSAKRYVSTSMYEWPHPNHSEHCFPLAKPHLLGQDEASPTLPLSFDMPVTVGEFGKEISNVLEPSLQKWKANYKHFLLGESLTSRELLITATRLETETKKKLQAMLTGQVSIHGIPLNDVVLPAVKLDTGSGVHQGPFTFRYVIYAVGFGTEANNYSESKPPPYSGYEHRLFWDVDLIPAPNLGFSTPPRVGILGSGDGALQDALRCLVKPGFAHPIAIWNEILEFPQSGRPRLMFSRSVDKALARVAAADVYTTGGAIWSNQLHIFESLDKVFKEIVSELSVSEGPKLERAIRSMLRKDVQSLTLVTRRGYFTKAYALNRFLIHLFLNALNEWRLGSFEILSGEIISFTQIAGSNRGAVLTIEESPGALPVARHCELAIIRGGLDMATAPTQLVGLTGIDAGRVELGRIPPSIRPIGIP